MALEMYILVLSVVLLIVACRKLRQRGNDSKYGKSIPKALLRTWPKMKLVVNQLVFGKNPMEVVMQILCGVAHCFSNEGIFSVSLLSTVTVIVYRSEIIKDLLNCPEASKKAEIYKLTKFYLGDGLIGSEGEIWRMHKKFISPSFCKGALKDYIGIFNSHSNDLIKVFRSMSDKKWVEVDSLIEAYMLVNICECAMDVRMSILEENPELKEVVKYTEIAQTSGGYRYFRPWACNDLVFRYLPTSKKYVESRNFLNKFTSAVIHNKKYSMKTKSEDGCENDSSSFLKNVQKKGKMFLERLLIEHLKDTSFTLQSIQDEVLTFMLAGYETSAVTLKWALLLLGLHPEIQEKAIEEVDSALGNFHEDITLEDVSKLQYVECIIKETLRLYSSVPFIYRKVTADVTAGGWKIPKGAMVGYFLYMLHRDPRIYSNPELFDPERFLPENSANINSFTYAPFGVGIRMCIGFKFALLELVITLAHILRRFRLESHSHRDKVTLSFFVSLQNSEPLKIRFIPRKDL